MKIFLPFLIILAVIYHFLLADFAGDSIKDSVKNSTQDTVLTTQNSAPDSTPISTQNENLDENKTQILTEDDFITASEYGKYLYENPRGISCKSCHGQYGEGSLIAKYTGKDKEVQLLAPDITGLDRDAFSTGVNRAKGVMPKYYLTEPEIQAIYSYIAKP